MSHHLNCFSEKFSVAEVLRAGEPKCLPLWLNQVFKVASIGLVRWLVGRYHLEDRIIRPHRSLGLQSPSQFAINH